MRIFLVAVVSAVTVGPIQKVLQLVDELQAKVVSQGDESQQGYETFVDWCGKQAMETKHAIADATGQVEALTATVDTSTANIEELNSEIQGLTGSISRLEAEFASAKGLRKQEHEDFLARDANLARPSICSRGRPRFWRRI
jgi:peptidoglycan hydrolase CwlO-like protein